MPVTRTQTDEPILIHLHWMAFARDIGIICAGIILPLVVIGIILPGMVAPDARAFLASASPIFVAMWALALWMMMAVVWTKYYLSLWILTERFVINVNQNNLFDREVAGWDVNTITDVTATIDGAFENTFDYGSVYMRTTDEAEDGSIVATPIPHPDSIRGMILEHVRAHRTESSVDRQETLLRSISHEMKGHLARSEATFASILQGDFGAVPEPLKNVASVALADSRTGVETVMNILDSANLRKGTLTYTMQKFDLCAAMRGSVDSLRPDAEHKGLIITFKDMGSPCWIDGDQAKLVHHVLRNLIDNAIRYTPTHSTNTGQEGDIVVEIVANASQAQFSVTDTGVGIKPEDMAHLFTEGGKGKDSTEVNPASTGYGLYVAKQVVEGHGGKIWVESRGADKGSKFIVTLPIRQHIS